MPCQRYTPFRPVEPAGPHLARQDHHPGAALAVHRPAGRQPGADRPDEPGPQAEPCSTCWSGWATRRSRSASRRPARPTSTSSASLIEDDRIPDDVQISVLTQARDELIERTVQSLAGAPRATVHLYNATAPVFRRVVFGNDREETKALAVEGTRSVMKYAEQYLAALRLRLRVLAGDLHGHRAGLRRRGLRGR